MKGSLKSPCATSYRSSIATIALSCLVFENSVSCVLATDKQTDEQMDSIDALSRSRCRERRLNNVNLGPYKAPIIADRRPGPLEKSLVVCETHFLITMRHVNRLIRRRPSPRVVFVLSSSSFCQQIVGSMTSSTTS